MKKYFLGLLFRRLVYITSIIFTPSCDEIGENGNYATAPLDEKHPLEYAEWLKAKNASLVKVDGEKAVDNYLEWVFKNHNVAIGTESHRSNGFIANSNYYRVLIEKIIPAMAKEADETGKIPFIALEAFEDTKQSRKTVSKFNNNNNYPINKRIVKKLTAFGKNRNNIGFNIPVYKNVNHDNMIEVLQCAQQHGVKLIVFDSSVEDNKLYLRMSPSSGGFVCDIIGKKRLDDLPVIDYNDKKTVSRKEFEIMRLKKNPSWAVSIEEQINKYLKKNGKNEDDFLLYTSVGGAHLYSGKIGKINITGVDEACEKRFGRENVTSFSNKSVYNENNNGILIGCYKTS